MKTRLLLPADAHDRLLRHLLPERARCEEAAFIFARTEKTPTELTFHFVESQSLTPGDFVVRRADFLELTDATRAAVIKRAHDLGTSLIELHSHVGPWRAAFSYSDIAGLKDIVPHLWWRLRGRPYAAIVVARDGFDALVWTDNPHQPTALDELLAGERVLRPTNSSLEDWP